MQISSTRTFTITLTEAEAQALVEYLENVANDQTPGPRVEEFRRALEEAVDG